MIDIGEGPAVILVPGIQGRWEWMRPAVHAVGRRCRAISYSLSGEPGADFPVGSRPGFDRFVDQLDAVLDRARLERATICGVSYGGLIAARYAAQRPHRVEGLVLASTPAPTWKPDCQVEWYLRVPRLLAPLFVARSPGRLAPEVRVAFPDPRSRFVFAVRHTARVVAAPFSPVRMAERVRLLGTIDLACDCRAVRCPTLVVTGEPHLDRVVPVTSTRWYLDGIGHARGVTLDRTGHIGLITRPGRFAEIVAGFAGEAEAAGSTPARTAS